jgi:hypothetical protein
VSPAQPDTVGPGGTAPEQTVSNTTIGVDVLSAPESSSAPSDVDAGKFVQTLRDLPPWQTMRLPVIPFATYISSSVGLVVGQVDGLGDVTETKLTGADLGQPGLEGVLIRLDVSLRVEVDHGRSVLADDVPKLVSVPITIWIGGLPPDLDVRQATIIGELQATLPVGAEVAVLFTDFAGDRLQIVANGQVPSLGALTFGVTGGVLNADPATDAGGLVPDGPVASMEQLAAIVEARLIPR